MTDEDGVVAPRFDDRTTAFASATLTLLAEEPVWVRRRVELIDVLDRARVRRQMSIDFKLPEQLVPEKGPTPVPIGLFQKTRLRDFDVRDEEGRALPILTQEENAPVAAALLVSVAAGRLNARGERLPNKVARDLEWLSSSSSPTLADAARRRFDAPADDDPHGHLRRRLLEDRVAGPFIRQLHEQFILFVLVDGDVKRRRIVKISYEEALHGGDGLEDAFGEGRPRGGVASIRRIATDLIETSSAKPLRFLAPTPAIVDGASYHVEVAAPEDVFISYARLEVDTHKRKGIVVAEESGRERVHLSTSWKATVFEFWSLADVTWSVLDVRFSLRASGPVFSAWVISAVTTAILWGGLHLHRHHVFPKAEATTVVLVVLPAVYAAYLVPSQHRLVRRLSLVLRFFVLVSSLISFVAAASLTVELEATRIVELWRVLGWISLASTGVITVGLLAAFMRQHVMPKMLP